MHHTALSSLFLITQRVRSPLQADICQLGMDQRKVNVLAREYCDSTRPKRKLKPIILSHPMMPGLLVVRPASALHPRPYGSALRPPLQNLSPKP